MWPFLGWCTRGKKGGGTRTTLKFYIIQYKYLNHNNFISRVPLILSKTTLAEDAFKPRRLLQVMTTSMSHWFVCPLLFEHLLRSGCKAVNGWRSDGFYVLSTWYSLEKCFRNEFEADWGQTLESTKCVISSIWQKIRKCKLKYYFYIEISIFPEV